MGLVAWYPLNGDARDAVGGRHGEIVGSVNWTDGKLGKAASTAYGRHYIRVPHDPELSAKIFGVVPKVTLAAWVKLRSYNNHGLIVGKNSGGSYSNTTNAIWVNSSDVRFVVGSNESSNPSGSTAYAHAGSSFTLNTWHHVAAVLDGDWMGIYVDGVLVDSGSSALARERSENAADMVIGGPRDGGNEGVDGEIQDVRIYDHALSPREVRDLSLGLVGHYPLRRDAVNTAGYNSGILNGPVVFSAEMGGSAEFDNSSYIQLETGITGDPAELSASFWAKTDTLQKYDGLIQFDGVSSYEDGFVITAENSATMRFRYWSDGGTNITWPAGGFSSGKESHFCVTLKGNLFTLYQDGEKVGEHTYSNPFNLTGGVKLGLYSWSSNYFTGWINDARIYATALTAAQVKELYQQRVSIDSEGSVHTPTIQQNPRARYIRDWTNGSTSNGGNHWLEVRAVYAGENISLGKPVTASASATRLSKVTDGTTSNSGYASVNGTGPVWVQVDLEEVREIDEVQVWHYDSDRRTYYDTKTEISEDGINWTTIFDSAVSGIYQETPSGVTHQAKALGPIGATPHGLRVPDISEVGVTRGLVAWYPLVSDTLDYAGVNHAENNGAVLTAEGYVFYGGEHLLAGFTPGESTLGQRFTWTWWDRPSRFASNTGSHGSSGATPRLYKQWINASGAMRVGVGDSYWTAIPSNNIPLGAWSFFAVVFEEGEVRTYLNGQLQDTTSGVVFSGESSSAFSVGRGYSGERYYEGVSRDHRIYDRVLSPQEIALLHKLTAPGANTVSFNQNGLYVTGQIKEVIA